MLMAASASADQYLATEQGAGAVDGVQRHAQGFGHGALGVTDAVAQGAELARIDHDFLPERALDVGHAHRTAEVAHVQAVVLQPLLAKAAVVAGQTGVDCDPGSHRQLADGGADFFDLTGYLVAQHHGLLDADGAKATMLVVVQVGAADAAGTDAHAHLTRTHGGRRKAFDSQVVGGMYDQCFHDGIGLLRGSGG
jgi:hypothetical protein